MGDGIVFRSKIDWWLLTLLMCVVLVCFGVALEARDAAAQIGWLATGLITFGCLLGAVMPLWILFSTRYVMTQSELEIGCGPFHWTVPIADIENIEATRSPVSSPALSLDRLRIDYGTNQSIMISPENRDAFLRQLEGRRKSPH